ncbi:hypothetical protein RsoM2USA_169 [Ralstonia phage RsoM2USA]|nr:hypothetical protein RsoM2USA_169 [Ralstonia phage RsoM2USA]
MIDINEYILLPKTERIKHLDLNSSCEYRGTNSTQCRGLLAYYLDTNVPIGSKIHCCHACNDDLCSNPKHLYWGTSSENRIDFQKSDKAIAVKKRISNALKGKENPLNADWKNANADANSWFKAGILYERYYSNGWDFKKYGQGLSYFRQKYGISKSAYGNILKKFNDGWNPLVDQEWLIFNATMAERDTQVT